jgi:hypothetical protein
MRRLLCAVALTAGLSTAFAQGINAPPPVGPQGASSGPCSAFGTTAGTCAQGNDSRITGAAPASTTMSKLGQSTLPLVLVSSGSMGNNGALTGITAVPTAYPNAYVYLPAGAISSGSAAGWYYAVFSSTTAATVYNNTYTSGTPTIPASPTAFVTTGPGAYTQTTGSNIASYTLSIAGNTIGVNGGISVSISKSNNGTSNNKIFSASYSSFTFATTTLTTNAGGGGSAGFVNRGVTNVQVANPNANFLGNSTSGTTVYGAIDSTSAQNMAISMQLATATDTMTLESAVVELLPGVP